MIRRSWSHLFSGTALLLLLAGSAAAELTGVAPGQTPGLGVGVTPASDAQDIAGRLQNPISMPTEAPPIVVVPAAPTTAAAPAAGAAPAPGAAPASTFSNAPGPVGVPPGEFRTTLPGGPAVGAPAPATVPAPVVTAPAPVVAAPAVVAGVPVERIVEVLKADLTDKTRIKGSAEERRIRGAIAAFYEARDWQPLFVDGNGLTRRAEQAADRLRHAADDGLDPSTYLVGRPKGDAGETTLAEFEVGYAAAALRYAMHAMSGRFEPTRLSELATAKPPQVDPAAALAEFAASSDLSATLEAYNPPHEGYRRLKAKLAEMGGYTPPPPVVQVPNGPTLKPGQKDGRVAALRERLGVGATASDGELYDDPLVEAVKAFQKEKGLKPTGLVGPATVSLLNDPGTAGETKAVELKPADIVANMERWRWLPRELGSLHVFVNIPDYQLAIVRDGKEVHRTRVIVGRVANQTPVFSETMTHIIVNPYWNVPVSILKKEMLGKIQETAGSYLDRGNYEVVVGKRVVSASEVDWANVNPNAVSVRQRPGGGNALGNIKFMFPNQHSVYLHDTSSRGLFSQTYRALSHGCVRVHEPFAFADALLAEEPGGLDGKQLKGMIGGGEKYLWLKRKLEVHLAYFTAFVGPDGKLESRADVYGHNARTKKLLGI